MTSQTQALEGRFTEDGALSACGFSVVVVFNGTNTFRGSLEDVKATLTADRDGLSLEGTAHVPSEEFFDAGNHPEVTFRSTSVELGDDTTARVEGELTIAGTTREVSAEGTWRGPVKGPDSLARVLIDLETRFDRRYFGFAWQAELPGGGEALAWEVGLDAHLVLVQHDD